ncbi:DUF433 domain-containing protein [Actinophytocola sp.]|uniref:DUF433 domain-containing protein n=1 Tax=Actinophytocola sp. TaxID=1872138 RepID=UPI002D49EE52|nr:DUF433 domain-containing protein [Actinophytocola sp.]HYQ69024.1 DUF433 domain-containing protein [Actinophytocola sp.]
MLVPEVSRQRPILYSFRDVVALRTCVYLRKDSSPQRVRQSLGNLRNLGEVGHLSQYTLVSDDGSIVLVRNDEAIDLVEHPGQFVMAEMSDVLGPIVNRNDVQIPPLLRPNDHVEVDPEIRSGHPVVTGTRVPYENVAGFVADGVPMRSIKDYCHRWMRMRPQTHGSSPSTWTAGGRGNGDRPRLPDADLVRR